jgi:hypothetical protein
MPSVEEAHDRVRDIALERLGDLRQEERREPTGTAGIPFERIGS